MKKFMTIITSIALVVTGQMYTALVERKPELKPKTEAPKVTTPTLDPNHSRSSTPSSSSSSARSTPERGGILTDEMQRNIEEAIAKKQLGNIPAEHLVLYLETNKEQPGKRTNQLSIIEELGKDPQKVIANAQEIANAFSRFLASSASSTTNIRTLTNEQVTLLTSMAETMLKNQQGTSGLIIINQLLRKPDFVLKPETLTFIKKAIFAKNSKQAQETLTQFIETMLKNKNLSVVDLAVMADIAKTVGITTEKIDEWNKKVDALIATLTPQVIRNMNIVDLGTLLQTTLQRSPETGLRLLTQVMDNSPITPETFGDLIGTYQILLKTMKPIQTAQFKKFLSIMPTIVRMERVATKTAEKQAIETLKDVFKGKVKESKIAATDIANYITDYVDNEANNLEKLVTATQLTALANKKLGITNKEEAYNSWLAKIADKALVLNNNAINKLANITMQEREAQLRDMATLIELTRLGTNSNLYLYSPTELSKLLGKIDTQQKILTQNTSGLEQNRQLKGIKEDYNNLQKALNNRLVLLISSY